MEFLQPSSWREALAMKAAHPDALPIAGGTDVMVEINFDRQRPTSVLDLTRVASLDEWGVDGALLRIGAGVTYTRIIGELGDRLPGDGVSHGRLATDTESRHRGREPGLGFARR
jgi:CO/xanthine dehydrogenase FAD-binding subunit